MFPPSGTQPVVIPDLPPPDPNDRYEQFVAEPVPPPHGRLWVQATLLAFTLLVYVIVRTPGSAALAAELGRDWKGKVSILVYAISVPVALYAPLVTVAMVIGIGALWIVPDRRFERVINAEAD